MNLDETSATHVVSTHYFMNVLKAYIPTTAGGIMKWTLISAYIPYNRWRHNEMDPNLSLYPYNRWRHNEMDPNLSLYPLQPLAA